MCGNLAEELQGIRLVATFPVLTGNDERGMFCTTSGITLGFGVGLFALPLARNAEEVLAIETNPFAARDAEANAQAAGAGNLRVFRLDALAALAAYPAEPGERIVLDPPRTGAGAEVVQAIASRGPERVVYVSCDPPTLGRDLKHFHAAGYRPDRVELFDMFPDTLHLETVVALVR